MNHSSNLEHLAIREALAPRRAIGGVTPVIRLRRELAGNDAVHADPVTAEQEIDTWARRAVAANGFGDGAVSTSDASHSAASYELIEEARSHRAVVLGEMIAAAILALGSIVRRALAHYRRRREGIATYEALSQLDDRALRDLGFTRDELTSVAAETAGQIERTRISALRSGYRWQGTKK
jgi:uncharacterized protein YjiS (DUF1127 family)